MLENDQSYLDNGAARNVRVIGFDRDGNMSDQEVVVGQAATYAAAVDLVRGLGYELAPEGEGYDCGPVANPDGPDAYGIAVMED